MQISKDHLEQNSLEIVKSAINVLDSKGFHLMNSNWMPIADKLYYANQLFGIYRGYGAEKRRSMYGLGQTVENQVKKLTEQQELTAQGPNEKSNS